jgi:hypothetical protein
VADNSAFGDLDCGVITSLVTAEDTDDVEAGRAVGVLAAVDVVDIDVA